MLDLQHYLSFSTKSWTKYGDAAAAFEHINYAQVCPQLDCSNTILTSVLAATPFHVSQACSNPLHAVPACNNPLLVHVFLACSSPLHVFQFYSSLPLVDAFPACSSLLHVSLVCNSPPLADVFLACSSLLRVFLACSSLPRVFQACSNLLLVGVFLACNSPPHFSPAWNSLRGNVSDFVLLLFDYCTNRGHKPAGAETATEAKANAAAMMLEKRIFTKSISPKC